MTTLYPTTPPMTLEQMRSSLETNPVVRYELGVIDQATGIALDILHFRDGTKRVTVSRNAGCCVTEETAAKLLIGGQP